MNDNPKRPELSELEHLVRAQGLLLLELSTTRRAVADRLDRIEARLLLTEVRLDLRPGKRQRQP